MKQMISRALLSACAAVLMLPTAFAQSDGALEEIIVTAQKREQSLQDVGIAITAITGSQLQDRGIDSVIKIQDTVPNLRIKQTFGSGVPRYAIRGVGEASDTSVFSSSPVAIHVNEVPMPYPVTTNNLLFDLERVEVLRGPQGDLFGLNTTAGTINYITARPTDTFEGQALLEYGEFDRFKVQGYISGPISESLSGRVSVSFNERGEGWQYNRRTGEKLGEMSKTGARVSLSYAPSDSFTADFEYHMTRDDSDAMGMRNLVDFLSTGFGNDGTQGTVQTGWRDTDWSANNAFLPNGTKPFIDHEGSGASLRLNWDLDNMSLTSVSAFEKFEREEYLDWDGDQLRDSDEYFVSDLDVFSQELRLSGETDAGTSWMIGANFAKDEMDNLTVFDITENPFFPATAGQDMTQEREVWAVFTHLEFQLSDRLRLIGGLRYTDEKRDVFNIGTNLYFDGSPGFTDQDLIDFGLDGLGIVVGNGVLQDLSAIGAGIWGEGDTLVPSNTLATPGSMLTDADFGCFAFFPCFEGRVYDDSMPSSDVSWKIGLNFDASDNTMIYGNVSLGTKSGGFLETAASSSLSFTPVTTEELLAYEIGSKSTLANGRGRLNASVFYYDYENQQVSDSVVDPLFGPLGVLRNAPKSEMYGFEAELVFAVTENFEIGQNIGYSKGKFKEFTNSIDGAAVRNRQADCLANGDPNNLFCLYEDVFQDLSGQDLPFPEVQYSGYFNVEVPYGSNKAVHAVLDYSYEDETTSNATWTDTSGGSHSFNLPSYWMVNARVGLISDDGWELTLFADNLLDEDYLLSYARFNEAVVQAVGMPTTWGIRFRKDFD